ncbi:MAG: hypothetical protein A3D92_19340 [Bacteroidetes bacterium RIFCSPHIGHO2_02_FULL_44_7]|nr:MAG: hypothetical protein A3D92_19340 [Bacteroidetes bacterium RIFCSPHIGHO2_02_FULL_44_7]
MSNTFLSLLQLEQSFQSEDFRLKTQQQIQKDFAFAHAEFPEDFCENSRTLYDLELLVQHELAKVMEQSERHTLQLLYQIDIPQDRFLELTTDPDFLPKMSNLLIRREAYKVYLRSKF